MGGKETHKTRLSNTAWTGTCRMNQSREAHSGYITKVHTKSTMMWKKERR
jgi:hypothetical protein